MIVTVTLNPTLDKTLSVPVLRPGEVHRARFCARTSAARGSTSLARCAPWGWRAFRSASWAAPRVGRCATGWSRQGYDARFVEVPGETRQNLTLLDEATGVYTKINEPGPTIGPEHLAALHALVDEMAAPGDLWALCGSLPPGAPADFYADLVTAVQARGAAAILDTSETALRLGLAARPAGSNPTARKRPRLWVNGIQRREHVAAVHRLVDLLAPATPPAPVVCLTRGARGLLLAAGGELVMAEPPPVARAAPSARGMRHWRACSGRCPRVATRPRWRGAPWRAALPRRCRKAPV